MRKISFRSEIICSKGALTELTKPKKCTGVMSAVAFIAFLSALFSIKNG